MPIRFPCSLLILRRFLCTTSPTRNNMVRVLNVAEKNDAAKSLADIMSGGRYQRREGFSRFNKIYEFDYHILGQNSKMTMTSLSGHLLNFAFNGQYKSWHSCPPVSLFDAPVFKDCPQDYQDIKRTLEREARGAKTLIIWTDCDREGENIGFEVIQVCTAINPRLNVYRAKFSEITRNAVTRAVNNLVAPDKNTSDAVDVRQELDLRIGASFTRFQTLRLKKVFPTVLAEQLISYGSCQFPTLGFVVERYKQVQAFVPEPFWKIKVTHETPDGLCVFSWKRNRLFDHLACSALFEQVQEVPVAKVLDVKSKPKSKWRPAALDTVELEKLASRKLRINAKETMKIAEKLYTQGYISYPRTETNQFPKDFDLRSLVENQTVDPNWGAFARELLDTGITPRNGNKSDQAHPPIHPTKYTNSLQGNEARVYEFVVRHFLACCSQDARGQETTVDIDVNNENFSAAGLMIVARNYLDVYPYDKWNAKVIPVYSPGEEFEPSSIEMNQSETSPPSLLTEADLITLMDKHGIGTDATHAEHIETIKSRLYVGVRPDGKLVPGELGMGLVEGYDAMGYEMSKPHLRAELEADLKRICQGQKDKDVVLREQIAKYKEVFMEACRQANKIDAALSVYFGDAQEYQDTNTYQTIVPVMKCPQCSQDMTLRTKKDNKGYFVSCMGYPNCRNAIWLPDFVIGAKVEDTPCDQCAPRPVNKITFKFKRTPSLPPYIPTEHTACIGGCDSTFNEALSIRLTSPTRPSNPSQSQTRPSTNRQQRGGTNNSNDSGYGSSFNSTGPTQQRRGYQTTTTNNSFGSTSSGYNSISSQSRTNITSSQSQRPPFGNIQNSYDNDRTGVGMDRGRGYRPVNDSQRGGATRGGRNGGRGIQPISDSIGGDEEVVMCNCGTDARLLTVRKEGPNCGRQFYGCSKGQEGSCGFFLWADQDGGGGGDSGDRVQQNTRAPSTQPRPQAYGGGMSQGGGSGDGSDAMCNCSQPANQFTVNKDGPNKGRPFFVCPKGRGNGCDFFQWADEQATGAGGRANGGLKRGAGRGRGSVGSRGAFTSGDQSKKARKCGVCGEEGHNKRNCPNR